MKNKLINEEKKLKTKKKVLAAISVLAIGSALACASIQNPTGIATQVLASIFDSTVAANYVDLPSIKQTHDSVNKYLIDDNILFVNEDERLGRNVRFEIKKDCEKTYCYCPSNAREDQKDAIKDTIEKYNMIFSFINPAYKFEYTEDESYNNKYGTVSYEFVDILPYSSEYKDKEDNRVGVCHRTISLGQDGQLRSVKAKIRILNEITSICSDLSKVSIHEFAHVFGLEDLYLTDSQVPSIMGKNSNNNMISCQDYYAIASLYANMDDKDVSNRVIQGLDQLKDIYFMPDYYENDFDMFKYALNYRYKNYYQQEMPTISFEKENDFWFYETDLNIKNKITHTAYYYHYKDGQLTRYVYNSEKDIITGVQTCDNESIDKYVNQDDEKTSIFNDAYLYRLNGKLCVSKLISNRDFSAMYHVATNEKAIINRINSDIDMIKKYF